VRISEVARLAGIAPSAVRFYEQAGVIRRARRGGNGYREYDDADLAGLRLVVALRRLGLGPAESGRIATACVERRSMDGDLAALLARQRAAIDRRRVDLDRLEAEIMDLEDTVAAAGRNHRETGMPDRPLRVLFVCTGNSARSQIAEALLRHLGGADFEAASAGTQPKDVNPHTVTVLGEVGIDWTAARSKSVAEFLDTPFDYVVTVCDRARQACPVFPGEHNTLHWGLDDPAEVAGTSEEQLAAFRRTRLEVLNRLRPFIELARRSRGGITPGVGTGPRATHAR
jgi:arsenate reductase (thioredoxin)